MVRRGTGPTTRGGGREDIYLDDEEREGFVDFLGQVCRRFNWTVYAYCLMSNHCPLVVGTPEGNLSRGMRQLNGVYTQRFNRRHGRAGHVFQGRHKAIFVQKEAYLLELSRYAVLSSVRVRVVRAAADWTWGSYGAMTGEAPVPEWFDGDWLFSQFGRERSRGVKGFKRFARGMGKCVGTGQNRAATLELGAVVEGADARSSTVSTTPTP